MRRFAHVLGLTFLGAASPAAAQQPPAFEIEGLIVTGTSIPRARAQMGSSVTVIGCSKATSCGSTVMRRSSSNAGGSDHGVATSASHAARGNSTASSGADTSDTETDGHGAVKPTTRRLTASLP